MKRHRLFVQLVPDLSLCGNSVQLSWLARD